MQLPCNYCSREFLADIVLGDSWTRCPPPPQTPCCNCPGKFCVHFPRNIFLSVTLSNLLQPLPLTTLDIIAQGIFLAQISLNVPYNHPWQPHPLCPWESLDNTAPNQSPLLLSLVFHFPITHIINFSCNAPLPCSILCTILSQNTQNILVPIQPSTI